MVVILDKELQGEIDDNIKKRELIEQLEPKESLKVIKNTKGYNWEVKIFPKQDQTDEAWFNRLDMLNNLMIDKFGTLEN